jgi:hypothetical protein
MDEVALYYFGICEKKQIKSVDGSAGAGLMKGFRRMVEIEKKQTGEIR